jgi:Tol biopolymer transport system component
MGGLPAVCGHGENVIYEMDGNLWKIGVDGSKAALLTRGGSDHNASCSPDGTAVVFASLRGGKSTLWRVPLEGGSATPLTDYPAVSPAVSSDGKWIACLEPADRPGRKIMIVPFIGGRPTKALNFLRTTATDRFRGSLLAWSSDNSAITYVDVRDGVPNIWAQPLDGGSPRQLTRFKTQQIFSFAWSHDGQLAIARGTETSDAVVIRNYR